MELEATPFVLNCPPNINNPPGRILRMTAKRYTTRESSANAEGLTLLFAHCIGAHKEQWEPTLEQIFRQQHSKPRHHRVHDAWSFDWQNHGDAALLNRDLLETIREDGVSAFEWGEAIGAFVLSPRMKGRRIVAIGHSGGAGAMMSTMKNMKHISAIPYVSLVLIEPTIVTPDLFYAHAAHMIPVVVAATMMRREAWPSRDNAFEWLRRRSPWKAWDERVLRMLTEHGLTDTPDGKVTLKCDRRQEAISYPDVHPHFAALDEIGRVCAAVPVHVIWGDRAELVPEIIQHSTSDASQGRVVASVTKVVGGHMLAQENPDGLASAICDILDSIQVGLGGPARSRL
ncbi:Alpha/Beta hydrolase protein [Mycena rebaudengoi]|nr:Alpha/Beta hydrolase protein [Mycena rebaudengoi]